MASSPDPSSRKQSGYADVQSRTDFDVLTLLANEGDRQVLVDWLGERYTVVRSDDAATALQDGGIDLVILDPPSFGQHRDALIEYDETEHPHHVPYLLVHSQDTPLADSEALEYIDDMVVMPVEKRTLQWRIESMLNLRKLSVGLVRNRRQLEELAEAAAHDLRNPLNIAQGNLELIDDGQELERAIQSLDRMEKLIDNLLTVVKSAKSVADDDREWINLATMAEEVLRLIDIDESNLQTEDLADLTIRGKPIHVEQLLRNLFLNAAEHGGESVTVRGGRLESENGFYIEDDGVGVPDDLRDAVFESGYTTASGSGIGLSVVKGVCESHEWGITLKESSDGGTRFEFVGVQSKQI